MATAPTSIPAADKLFAKLMYDPIGTQALNGQVLTDHGLEMALREMTHDLPPEGRYPAMAGALRIMHQSLMRSAKEQAELLDQLAASAATPEARAAMFCAQLSRVSVDSAEALANVLEDDESLQADLDRFQRRLNEAKEIMRKREQATQPAKVSRDITVPGDAPNSFRWAKRFIELTDETLR